MEYERYTVEEFVLDDDFHQWVFQPTGCSQQRWQEFLQQHPHQRAVIEQARLRLLELRSALADTWLPSPAETTQMWQQIKKAIHQEINRPVNQLQPTALKQGSVPHLVQMFGSSDSNT